MFETQIENTKTICLDKSSSSILVSGTTTGLECRSRNVLWKLIMKKLKKEHRIFYHFRKGQRKCRHSMFSSSQMALV